MGSQLEVGLEILPQGCLIAFCGSGRMLNVDVDVDVDVDVAK